MWPPPRRLLSIQLMEASDVTAGVRRHRQGVAGLWGGSPPRAAVSRWVIPSRGWGHGQVTV